MTNSFDDSSAYYDSLAFDYGQISQKRQAYLSVVDDLVAQCISSSDCASWIDIGSGDGIRIFSIIRKLQFIQNITVIEPSEEMLALCRANLKSIEDITDYHNCSIEEFCSEQSYDVATSLWNVIGHSEDPLNFLKSIKRILSTNSIAMFDCNNSFNIRHYGIGAIANIFISLLFPEKILKFPLRSGDISTKVKILNPVQLKSLLRQVGLTNVEIKYFDYKTGSTASWYSGQIFILARP